MSWEIRDSKGGGDFLATNSGIIRLRDDPKCPPSLARFLTVGKAGARLLKQIQAECKSTPGFKRISARFKDLAAPVVLTDGVESSAPWEELMHGKDWTKDVDPSGWLASEKLDGVRAFWDGHNLWTRGGNEIRLPRLERKLPAGFALDGELWAGRGKLQVARVAAQYGKDSPAVRFMAFDAPEAKGGWLARMTAARRVWRGCVAVWTVKDMQHLFAKLDEIMAAGGEGIVIREPNAAYTVGRVTTVLKVKP